jgi:sugar (pentulose or hexulose) kinase
MGKIVIGVDSSTQSTKAIAWDINGKALDVIFLFIILV